MGVAAEMVVRALSRSVGRSLTLKGKLVASMFP